jgi:hypothetical protein
MRDKVQDCLENIVSAVFGQVRVVQDQKGNTVAIHSFAAQYLVDLGALLKEASIVAQDILINRIAAVLLFEQETDADRVAGCFDQAFFLCGIGIFVFGSTMATNRLGSDVFG